jgi:hypothetical protein
MLGKEQLRSAKVCNVAVDRCIDTVSACQPVCPLECVVAYTRCQITRRGWSVKFRYTDFGGPELRVPGPEINLP